jgi:hypothetical protein
LIDVDSISAFDKIFVPKYVFDVRYPLRPLSFEIYMRLHKERQVAGIALRDCEFDYQRRKIVEDDEKFQYRNPLLQTPDEIHATTILVSGSGVCHC